MKILAILALVSVPTSPIVQSLPAAVERAAYIGGRCSTYFTIGDRERAMIQGSGALMTIYRRGIADSKTSPLTRTQCQTLITKAGSDLEKYLRP